MTILDPILYCGGRLRLTRHGDKGGGTSLVIVDPSPGFTYDPQLDVPDAQTEALVAALDKINARDPYYAMGFCLGALGRNLNPKGA